MRRVKPLLLSILTCSLLSCNPVTTRMGDEKTSDCGEIPVGLTLDKRAFDLAGATMAGISLGKLEIKDEPQFQKIISEAASNSAATDILVCKAIARAGVRGNPEMVDYFTRMTHFYASHPNISEQLQWKQANPFPSAATQERSNLSNNGTSGSRPSPQESLSDRLAKLCKQPIIGLRRPPVALLRIWLPVVSRLRQERFPPEQDLVNLYNFKSRIRDDVHTPEDFFRESLYTLKCLEDEGELRLEPLGIHSKYEGKDFENQRIDFAKPPIANSNEWRRLSDSDKTQLSLFLSNGNRYKIDIYRMPTPDCIRLATDFYYLFNQLGWTVRKPQTPESEPEPGIRVMSIGDNIPSAPIKNMKEKSGALLLTEALQKIKLPVMYEARGGMIEDLTIDLVIGMKPESK